MEFRILGPLEVEAAARPVVLPRGRARSLLALLITRAGEVVPTERLIDELWGHAPPRTATTALHGLVAALRRRLEPARRTGQAPAVLRTTPPGYVLAIEQAQVDAGRFTQLVEAATGASPPEQAALLREALGLWRGPALAEFTYEPFAQAAITALSELRLAATEERIAADLACGRHAEVVGEAEAMVAEHPLRERLRAQLMLALYRCGRQAEALEAYADARRTLVEELGIEPGPALRDLERAILRQDRALDLAEPAVVAVDSTAGPSGVDRADRSWLTQSRKSVTVVFVDLAGAPADRADPEALHRIVRRGSDVAAEVLGRHGGTVEGIIGDVVVAVFGVPVAHEDDAVRAVRAAAELRGVLTTLNAELRHESGASLAARIGVNTGEVLVGDTRSNRTAATGDTVNVAARLQQAALDGDVLLGEATRRLVAEVVVVEPVEPVARAGDGQAAAWRLVEVLPDAPTRAPRLDAPMVGRDAEQDRLRMAFARTMRRRRPTLVTVVGEAGVGKSRLALEFTRAVEGRARIVVGRCPSYGEGITFWPLREIVLEAAGNDPAEGIVGLLGDEHDARETAAQILSAVGLRPDAGTAAELFPAVRRFIEALARDGPAVVVIEDVHWAQPTLLDLLDYLAGSAEGAVLLVCLARPEMLERRPGWAHSRERGELLRLEPLGADDAGTLIAQRLGGRALPPDSAAQILDTAQGNPLFVEQLVAALRDTHELILPPSLQALLAARIDRLGPAERDVLRCASVVGVDFSLRALAALVPVEARPFLDRHVRTLERKELLRPSDRIGAAGRGFRHVLVQRAAYRSMTRTTRAGLHERFARWLESDAGAGLLEIDELIGYHLEQAYLEGRDLGVAEDHTAALAVEAGERLSAAGVRAHHRLDVAAAANLLARARRLLPRGHPRRHQTMILLAEAYPVLGRHADAETVLTELLDDVGSTDDGRLAQLLRLERARVLMFLGPDPISLDRIRTETEQALATFEACDDQAAVAKALFVLGLVHRRKGATAALEAAARRGLAAARRAGHAREEAGARWNVAWAVQAGATPVPEAIRVCEELAPLGDTLHPGVLCELAVLRAMLGELDQARELVTRTRRLMVERWRHRGPLMYPAVASSRVATLAGEHATAEHELRAALELAGEMGVKEHVSQVAAALAQVLTTLGHTDEAERFAHMSTAAAPAESVASQALWRAAAALVRSDRGDHGEAERLARAAVALAPRDMLNLRADLHAVLADVLASSGQRAAARAALTEAGSVYERKGNVVAADRMRAFIRRPVATRRR